MEVIYKNRRRILLWAIYLIALYVFSIGIVSLNDGKSGITAVIMGLGCIVGLVVEVIGGTA